MTAGSISRRCRCRDDNGKDLGSKCAKLKQRNHGTWAIRQELPSAPDGTRRTFRRGGYAVKVAADDVRDTQPGAQDDLDRLRELLNIGKDEDECETVAALIDGLGKNEPLPSSEEVRRKLRAGVHLSDGGSLGEWMDEWLANQTGLRRSSWKRYECDIRNHIKPHIGHVRRDRASVGHVRELFNRIEDTNDKTRAINSDRNAIKALIKQTSKRAEKRALREQLAALPPYRRVTGKSSQVRVLACLRKALNDLIAEQKATFNAATHVKITAKRPRPKVWTAERIEEWRRTGERPGPVMVWTPAQVGVFQDHVAEHSSLTLQALFHVALYRGPRRGELCGLGWTETDVDNENKLEITKQLLELEFNNLEEGDPKSDAGERTVPLDGESVRLTRAVRHWQRIRKLELGAAWVDSGRTFTNDDGSQIRPSWLTDEFERLYTAAGLPPIRFHDLRHVAATLMLAAGIDMKVVQETLGHAALATTSDTYTSVLPEIARTAAEKVVAIVPRQALTKTSGHPTGTQEINSTVGVRGDAPVKSETPQVDRGLSAV